MSGTQRAPAFAKHQPESGAKRPAHEGTGAVLSRSSGGAMGAPWVRRVVVSAGSSAAHVNSSEGAPQWAAYPLTVYRLDAERVLCATGGEA